MVTQDKKWVPRLKERSGLLRNKPGFLKPGLLRERFEIAKDMVKRRIDRHAFKTAIKCAFDKSVSAFAGIKKFLNQVFVVLIFIMFSLFLTCIANGMIFLHKGDIYVNGQEPMAKTGAFIFDATGGIKFMPESSSGPATGPLPELTADIIPTLPPGQETVIESSPLPEPIQETQPVQVIETLPDNAPQSSGPIHESVPLSQIEPLPEAEPENVPMPQPEEAVGDESIPVQDTAPGPASNQAPEPSSEVMRGMPSESTSEPASGVPSGQSSGTTPGPVPSMPYEPTPGSASSMPSGSMPEPVPDMTTGVTPNFPQGQVPSPGILPGPSPQ